MTRTRLILIPAMASEPAPFLVFDDTGAVIERGALTLDDAHGRPSMRTVAVAPGADVLIRWLHLPNGSPAQQRAAALWSLKESLAADPQRLTVALGPVPPVGEPRLTAVVSTALLEAWRDWLADLGAPADVLFPDMLAPAPPADERAVAAMTMPGGLALRGADLAVTVQPDLVPLILGDRTPLAIEGDEAIERQLIEAARLPPVNLLARVEAATGGVRRWALAAGLALAVLASPLILTVAEAARNDVMASRLNAQTRDRVLVAAPELATADDPVAALRRRLENAPPTGRVSGAAAALYVAIEGVAGAELNSLSFEPDAGVRATLAYPAFQDLETIRLALAPRRITLTDLSTVEDEGRVVSEVRLGADR